MGGGGECCCLVFLGWVLWEILGFGVVVVVLYMCFNYQLAFFMPGICLVDAFCLKHILQVPKRLMWYLFLPHAQHLCTRRTGEAFLGSLSSSR